MLKILLLLFSLRTIEDHLPWCTRFESFLVSHALLGMLDGSITMLRFMFLIILIGNPWILNTIIGYVLIKLLDPGYLLLCLKIYSLRSIMSSSLFWFGMDFNPDLWKLVLARSLELKCMLRHVSKTETQSMDTYLLT